MNCPSFALKRIKQTPIHNSDLLIDVAIKKRNVSLITCDENLSASLLFTLLYFKNSLYYGKD